MLVARITAAVLLAVWAAAAAVTVEIRGRITNQFPEKKYQAVVIIVTDRLGVEIGRTNPDRSGQYALKITGPRYIIVKATLDGYPDAIYQLDTEEIKESTADREENKVFGEMRIPIYYQNISFGEKGSPAEAAPPTSLSDLLAREDPKAVSEYESARRLKEAGDLNKAVAMLEKLIKKYPSFYIGQIDLGMILAAQQENDRALEVFTQANKLRPERSWGYIGLGVALNNKQDYQGAAQHLEKAVAIEPDSINAQFQLGLALFNLGDNDRALGCLQRVVELDPKFNPMAYKYLSSIYIKKADPEGASRALTLYLTSFPDAPDRDRVVQILKKLGH